jgi:hypothetical protein
MSYGQLLQESEPATSHRCANCTAELARKRTVWLLFFAGSLTMALLAGMGIAYASPRWGVPGMVGVALLSLASFTMVVSFCGWVFVGWKISANSPDRRNAPRVPAHRH